MTVRQRADALLTATLSMLWLPGQVLEEGIHALAASPWSTSTTITFDLRGGRAETVVRFREGTPDWAIRFAYLAPNIAAAVAAAAVIVWWIVSGPLWWPTSTIDWILLSILGAQYLAIAIPSADDVNQTPEGVQD